MTDDHYYRVLGLMHPVCLLMSEYPDTNPILSLLRGMTSGMCTKRYMAIGRIIAQLTDSRQQYLAYHALDLAVFGREMAVCYHTILRYDINVMVLLWTVGGRGDYDPLVNLAFKASPYTSITRGHAATISKMVDKHEYATIFRDLLLCMLLGAYDSVPCDERPVSHMRGQVYELLYDRSFVTKVAKTAQMVVLHSVREFMLHRICANAASRELFAKTWNLEKTVEATAVVSGRVRALLGWFFLLHDEIRSSYEAYKKACTASDCPCAGHRMGRKECENSECVCPGHDTANCIISQMSKRGVQFVRGGRVENVEDAFIREMARVVHRSRDLLGAHNVPRARESIVNPLLARATGARAIESLANLAPDDDVNARTFPTPSCFIRSRVPGKYITTDEDGIKIHRILQCFDPSVGPQIITRLLPFLVEYLGMNRESALEMAQICDAYYRTTDARSITNRRLGELGENDPHALRLLVTAIVIWRNISHIGIYGVPLNWTENQIAAVKEPAVEKVCFYYCDVCMAAKSMVRDGSGRRINRYKEAFFDTMVGGDLLPRCKNDETDICGRRCGDVPLRAIPLIGRLVRFSGMLITICPQGDCGGQHMRFMPETCEWTEKGPACNDCTRKIRRERAVHNSRLLSELERCDGIDNFVYCDVCRGRVGTTRTLHTKVRNGADPAMERDHLFMYPLRILCCGACYHSNTIETICTRHGNAILSSRPRMLQAIRELWREYKEMHRRNMVQQSRIIRVCGRMQRMQRK